MNPFEPKATATLSFSDWFVVLDALEHWAYENVKAGSEARMIRRKLPEQAVDRWLSSKDLSPPSGPPALISRRESLSRWRRAHSRAGTGS